MMNNNESYKFLNFTIDFFSGAIAGVGMVVSAFPFDTIKVRLQANSGKNFIKILKECFINEGITGFYKGMSLPLLTNSIINAGSLAANELARKIIGNTDESKLTVLESTFCGYIAGIAVTPVATSTELVKCRLQLQTLNRDNSYYKGVRDVLKKEFNLYGIKGIFKGNFVTFQRETLGYGAQFGLYQYFKILLSKNDSNNYHNQGSIDYMLAGAISGMAAWVVTYQTDICKTLIQTGTILKDSNLTEIDHKFYKISGLKRYNYKSTFYDGGALSCFKHIYYSNGFNGLYKGIGPTIVGTFISNGVMFVLCEHTKKFLDRKLL